MSSSVNRKDSIETGERAQAPLALVSIIGEAGRKWVVDGLVDPIKNLSYRGGNWTVLSSVKPFR